MSEIIIIFNIVISAIFINNFVLSRFLGICPFIGVSKKIETSIGMGFAVIFVMSLASAITFLIQKFILIPYKINYLQTISFILVIATLVQFIEMVIKKQSQGLYQALGIYLPLITTNCAVLGVTLLNLQKNFNFIEAVINGFSSGVGFMFALLIMAGIRERLEYAEIPEILKGASIIFFTAGLLSISFIGFSGIVKM
ncbi:MAG TPA: electron transport complex subunit RsxA [bacterium]|nr:electron transport complex subunit RsxA [bacterium]HOL48785.1 electron transport complex subunit RsxA [bacterium]HPQ19811.1 electron transport complex subunit RsxA [bacterium]